jgi:hypothetical protein
MISLGMTVARHRIFYPRPILALPDILMIEMSVEFHTVSLPLGRYHPILVETIAEQHEIEAYLDEERHIPCLPDLLDTRPSVLPGDHIVIVQYGPPAEDWPYVLLCRWPPGLTTAVPEELELFARGAYTIELIDDREQLEQASDRLLGLLKRRRRTRIEIVLPDWSAVPGEASH